MYLRCPRQWEFRYIEGIKVPPVGAIIQGKAYHAALADNFIHKMFVETDLTEEDVADSFSTHFDTQVHQHISRDEEDTVEFDEVNWEGKEPGKIKDEGISLVKLYRQRIASSIKPVSVELEDNLLIGLVQFNLITDLVTEDTIIDHKVKSRRFSDDDLQRDLQATAYSLAYNLPFNFHVALKQTKPEIAVQATTRTERDWAFFRELVPLVWRAIQTGIYPPSPNGWHCSEQWCGYWKLCQGRQ